MMTTAKRNHPDELIVGLVLISDRASQGVYEDKGVPSLQRNGWGAALSSPWRAETRLIQDDAATISATLVELVDTIGYDLVLTTGGTGPARRDVTPEATLAVTTTMPGFGEQMRQISLNFVTTAILSRQVAVIREPMITQRSLLSICRGQPKSIKEMLEGLKDADGKQKVPGIFASVPYCIDLIGGPYIEPRPDVVAAFRPKSAQRRSNKARRRLRTRRRRPPTE